MSSVLSSLFSRDPKTTFPYELPTESFTTVPRDIFVGKSGKKNDALEKATCFWSTTSANSSLKAQAQKLKTLRHPNVLTYVDSLEVDGTFYLITESCRPLAYYLKESKLTDTQRELLVSWGLYQVMNCLKFLHSEAKLSHNNLEDAIFVTASGDWKLAAFHHSGSFSSPQTDLNTLAAILVRTFSKNSEGQMGGMAALNQIPKRAHPLYRRLSAKGKSVMAISDILNECRSMGGFMKNKFVDTLLFLEEFQLREAAEKQSFFVHLNSSLDIFPEDIALNKILPKLIHTYEYGDAGAHILVPMFKLGRLLEEEEYQQRIVPCLVKLFGSTDRTTRVKLLERIDEFAGHLKPPIVNEKIYSNLVSGFLDSNCAVRESTVKAMVVIADKLNYANMNTDLMKYLARLQGSDPEPSIRTNTTICLGKIGCYIDASHRQRILTSAFTRALRDPFPPARMAGVIALSATQQYFSLAEVAQKVLPALAPLTIDPEKQVRDHSFKAMSGFLEKLQKASDNPALIPELEAQVKAGGRGGLLSGDKVPHWAGWAIKTISGKFYKSSPKESAATVENATKTAAEEEKQTKPAREETDEAAKRGKPAAPRRTGSFSSSSHSSISAKRGEEVASDGWGELLDEEEEDGGREGVGRGGGGEEGEESDYGEGSGGAGGMEEDGGRRGFEDTLWGEAMDSWESVLESTPKIMANPAGGKSSGLKLSNTPNSLSATSSHTIGTIDSHKQQQRQSQSASPAMAIKKGGGASLKLGNAAKKQQAEPAKRTTADNDLDDLLLGLGGEKQRNSNAIGHREGSEGNFATVAKQISQQQQPQQKPEEQQPKKQSAPAVKKAPPQSAESNSWQDW